MRQPGTAAEMEPFVQLSPLFTSFVWFVIVLVVVVVDGFCSYLTAFSCRFSQFLVVLVHWRAEA